MATLNSNKIFLSFGGVNVHLYFTKFNLAPTAESVEVTAGSETTDKQYAPGLNDTKATASLAYEITAIPSYIQKMKAGATFEVIYGSEGDVSGKPKHVQEFMVMGAPHERTVNKDFVIFDVDLQALGAPTVDMFAGGVWS